MKNIFKMILTLALASCMCQVKAQSSFAEKVKTKQASFNVEKFKSRLAKKPLRSSVSRLFGNSTIVPNVSVDLLNGSGIHLFNISDIGSLPTINVGARIKAGITIHL